MATSNEPTQFRHLLGKGTLQLVPHFGPALGTLYDGFLERRSNRQNDVVATFTTDDWQRLFEAMAEHEQLEATFVRAVEEAAQSGIAAKRRALGRVCLAAAYDNARIDEATLVVGVLAQLEGPHVAALSAIYRADINARERGEVLPRAQHAERELNTSIQRVAERFPPMVLGLLAAHGLIEGPGEGFPWPRVVGVTDFGEQVMSDLLAAGLE